MVSTGRGACEHSGVTCVAQMGLVSYVVGPRDDSYCPGIMAAARGGPASAPRAKKRFAQLLAEGLGEGVELAKRSGTQPSGETAQVTNWLTLGLPLTSKT